MTNPLQAPLATVSTNFPKPPDTALLYVRVSKRLDKEKGHAISDEMQRAMGRNLPELQGLTVKLFQDIDKSGKDTEHRPSYLMLVRELAQGGVKYVVSYDLSRMTRHMGDQQDFFDAMTKQKVLFIESYNGGVMDPADEDDELFANIKGSINQHERKRLARRLRQNLAARVKRGELVGPVPAGYIRKKRMSDGIVEAMWIEHDAERAAVVRTLFEDYATGAYSFASLAKKMNERGVKPPRAAHFKNSTLAADIFTSDVIKDLLSNVRYKGLIPLPDGSAVYPGKFEAIIDTATWDTCENVRKRNGEGRGKALVCHGRGSRGKWQSAFALTSLLRCGLCQSTMRGEKKGMDRSHPSPRSVYTCFRRRHTKDCEMPAISASSIEEQIIGIIEAASIPDAFGAAVQSFLGVVERPQPTAVANVRSLGDRLDRLNEMYELGRVSRDDYESRYYAVKRALDEARDVKPVNAVVVQREDLMSVAGAWRAATPDERRSLLATIFEQVEADDKGFKAAQLKAGWVQYFESALRAYQETPSPVFRSDGTRRRVAAPSQASGLPRRQ